MENIKLFNIPHEVRKAYEQLEVDEETGEIKGYEELEAVISQSREKILGTVGLIKRLQSVETATTARIQELTGNRDALRKKQERLRQLVASAMKGLDVQRLKDPVEGLGVSLQERDSVVFSDDENDINAFAAEHPELTTVRTSLKKIEIRNAIRENNGEVPAGLGGIVRLEPCQTILIRTSGRKQNNHEDGETQ